MHSTWQQKITQLWKQCQESLNWLVDASYFTVIVQFHLFPFLKCTEWTALFFILRFFINKAIINIRSELFLASNNKLVFGVACGMVGGWVGFGIFFGDAFFIGSISKTLNSYGSFCHILPLVTWTWGEKGMVECKLGGRSQHLFLQHHVKEGKETH